MRFQDLINEQKNVKNDAIFTKPQIAKFCISKIDTSKFDKIIEPSAGNGSFSNLLQNCIALDIAPQSPSIKKQNFFDYKTKKGNVLVIGNPPFGKANELCLRFLNHASSFAKTIAFILPKSCQKETFINKLNKNIHLRRVVNLPRNCFLIGDKSVDIGCNFFIFDVKEKERKDAKIYSTNDFSFCRKDDCDFAILRKGWNVGRVLDKDDTHYSDHNKTYIKANISVTDLRKRFETLSYPEAYYTLGSHSLAHNEVVKAYYLKYGKQVK